MSEGLAVTTCFHRAIGVTAFVFAALGFSGPSPAADTAPTVLGVGGSNCRAFLQHAEADDKTDFVMTSTWIFGYLSSVNEVTFRTGQSNGNVTEGVDYVTIVSTAIQYCEMYPDDYVSDAVRHIVSDVVGISFAPPTPGMGGATARISPKTGEPMSPPVLDEPDGGLDVLELLGAMGEGFLSASPSTLLIRALPL